MRILKANIALILFLLFSINISAQVLIDLNAEWSYFKGLSEPDVKWKEVSSWTKGNAPFRYGDGSGGTLLSDMPGNYSTIYIYKDFSITDVDAISTLKLSIDYDDGFIVWVNGSEVLKINAPDNIAYDQFALENKESGTLISYDLPKAALNLVNGPNTIAIQGFNVSNASSDFYLNVKLEQSSLLPEAAPVTINTPSGFFTNPFTVITYATLSGETVKYTLDGSDPRYSANAITATSPVSITIDPISAQGGRGQTGGVILRASKFEAGLAPSKPVTRSYIFSKKIKTQTHPGGSWPTTNVNGQILDFAVNNYIPSENRYKYYIDDALLDIPTISISTDLDNLFSSSTGIYVNAQYHGSAWERPANVELIHPNGSQGFNIDAGIRIRGGWSRHDNYPKHAFRLFFSAEYGETKLRFPLFDAEGVAEFDKIDLRTSQNYSWANGGSQSTYNTMNRDVFSRDTQRDMGHPYTRSRYYHLYLNGLYWGIYQTQERAEAAFASSYFGGNRADYDVIKVDIGDNFNLYDIEATDGNLDAWNEIWARCVTGFATNESYFNLLGLNAAGEADTSLTAWIDVDNFIDYMLIIFHTGNFDAPVSKFSSNYNPNNFYAIKNRTRKREGFKFFQHDGEHTLLTDAVSPGIGINENRVNITMNVTSERKFHPQWLHFKLSANAEYRMRFADRVYRHYFNNGALTPEACIARFLKTSDQLDLAIIAESAKWGHRGSWPSRTKDDDWLPAVNEVINEYFPYRSDIVINQLIAANLYVTLNPPVFKNNAAIIVEHSLVISENYNLTIENTNNLGTTYYTTDGKDPRAVGGAASPSALTAESVVVLPGQQVKARIKNGDIWSAIREVYFEDNSLFTNLKVTELHYNPLDQGLIGGKEYEFIELKNTGYTPLNLSGIKFNAGITYTFPEGTTLAPQSFVVVASNTTAFTQLYKFTTPHQYAGSLSNAGETITLTSSTNEVIFSFLYSDKVPWPKAADGDGFSLVSAIRNPIGNPNLPNYWVSSGMVGGSPMSDDTVSSIRPSSYENSINLQLFPNPAKSVINLTFSLNTTENIEVGLYDFNGRQIHLLERTQMHGGKHSLTYDLTTLNLNSGIYLITFKTKSSYTTQKMVYSK